MVDYVVNVSFRVDSRPLKNLNKEVEETTESLKKATSASERTRQRLVDGFDKVSNAANAARGGIGGIGKELVSMARIGPGAINHVTVALISLAATAAIAVGILVSVTSQLNEIHKLNDISDITGANVQELAKLEAIAKLGGESLDGLKRPKYCRLPFTLHCALNLPLALSKLTPTGYSPLALPLSVKNKFTSCGTKTQVVSE